MQDRLSSFARSPEFICPESFDFITVEAWIPDTLRFASLANEVGNDASHFTIRQIANAAIGDGTHAIRHSRPRKRLKGAESVGNPGLGGGESNSFAIYSSDDGYAEVMQSKE